jgi:hypothetical protein
MPSISTPERRFIIFLFLVKNLITLEVYDVERREKIRRGVPIPSPKAIKERRLEENVEAVVARAKSAAINKGLHGTIIAPKKNP